MSIYFMTCDHSDSSAVRVGGDSIASAWECDVCAYQRPFVDSDYEFCNASRWVPPAQRGFFSRA